MSEITITQANFDAEVLNSELPVLVDFWATWCGPCRMVAPTVSQIAEEYAGRVKVGKVNVDEQPRLAAEYGIEAIPALLVFKGGKVVNRGVGAMPKASIEALIK